MPRLETSHPIDAYLRATRFVDHDAPEIAALVASRGWRSMEPAVAIRSAFEHVRDEVRHSWDVRSHRVTRTASECLRHGEGLCYSKSMLLAALLRAIAIPAGLVYQRLTIGDALESGFCLHGLTTVYVASLGRWIRVDARGNKPGIDAQLSLDPEDERLAFRVRPTIGEIDYLENLPDPPPSVVRALEAHDDLHALVGALPERPD
jgi:transglutaminase-like putative cysteine protease